MQDCNYFVISTFSLWSYLHRNIIHEWNNLSFDCLMHILNKGVWLMGSFVIHGKLKNWKLKLEILKLDNLYFHTILSDIRIICSRNCATTDTMEKTSTFTEETTLNSTESLEQTTKKVRIIVYYFRSPTNNIWNRFLLLGVVVQDYQLHGISIGWVMMWVFLNPMIGLEDMHIQFMVGL